VNESGNQVVLNIDEHRNHLAVQEAYDLLADLLELPVHPDTRRYLNRVLIRLRFFLLHSKVPHLNPADRFSLLTIGQQGLATALGTAEDQRRQVEGPLSE